ncbi:MAG: pirin family protein [Chitinophagales bacterium]
MSNQIKHIISAFDINMGGILLKQALPAQEVEMVDPFLLLHHARFGYKDSAPAIQQGLGPHPHRGFTPVTFIIEGEVHHRDSRGNSQVAKEGEVQWMHAGVGIIHSERPSQGLADRNGKQEIIQLWINSPAISKMKPPSYQYVPKNDIPVFYSEDESIANKLIAGNYEYSAAKIKAESELLIVWGKAEKDGEQQINIPKGYNAMLYVIKGEMDILTEKVGKKQLVVFENGVEEIAMTVKADTQFLLLCGKPLNEKVMQQGPFVMNTDTEIWEAMRDYQMGKMGFLVEE